MSLGGLERYAGYVCRLRKSSFRSPCLSALNPADALLSLSRLSRLLSRALRSVELDPDLLEEARAGVAEYSCSELTDTKEGAGAWMKILERQRVQRRG